MTLRGTASSFVADILCLPHKWTLSKGATSNSVAQSSSLLFAKEKSFPWGSRPLGKEDLGGRGGMESGQSPFFRSEIKQKDKSASHCVFCLEYNLIQKKKKDYPNVFFMISYTSQ